jgi:hypothetical protein
MQFQLWSIFQSTDAPNALRHHFSCPLQSFTFVRTSFNMYTFSELLLARNYCLGELAFNCKWNWLSQLLTHKSEGRFEQIPTRIWWRFWLRLLRLVILTFPSVPQGCHWYLKAGPLPPPSTLIKIMIYLMLVYFWTVVYWHWSIILVTSLDRASSQSEQTHTRSFFVSVTFPLKTNF